MVFGVPSIPRYLKIETWNLQYLQNPLSSYSIQIFIELRQREHQFLDTQKNAIIGQTLYLYVYRARQANISIYDFEFSVDLFWLVDLF